jgi:hypothetical protein
MLGERLNAQPGSVEASTTSAWAEVVAGIRTGEAPRDLGQGVDTAVEAASGAGEVIPLQMLLLVQYFNHNTLIAIDSGFNVFFLPAAGWDFMPPYGRFFLFFSYQKRKIKRSRGFYFSSREGFYPLRP